MLIFFYFVVKPPHGGLPLRVPPADRLQGLGPGQAGVLRQGTEILVFFVWFFVWFVSGSCEGERLKVM